VIPPTELWNDEPTTCLRVNVAWRSHMVGLLGKAVKAGYWDENQLEGEDGINEIMNALLEECLEQLAYTTQYVIVTHRLSQNTAGGATVANAITQFPYNTLERDDTGEATLSSNSLELPAGRWEIDASHVIGASVASGVRAFLEGDVTIYAHNENLPAGDRRSLRAFGCIDLFVPTNISYHYHSNTAQATSGLGAPRNITPFDEIYGTIVCKRLTLV